MHKKNKNVAINISKKTIVGLMVGLFALLLVLVVLGNSVYTVHQDEYAYVTRFSKVVDIKEEAGLGFKAPFIDSIKIIPKCQMLYDIPPSDVITADKQTLVVDNFTIWRINNPEKFMKTIANISEMENRISASVYNAVKNIIGGLTRAEIINENTSSVDMLSQKVTEAVNANIGDYGVTITSVEIKRLDLPETNAEAVYTRMISERTQMADAYEAEGQLEAQRIRNETDKEVSVIKATAEAEAKKIIGEAESEYMRILSEAYNTPEKEEFYKFLRGLEALEVTMNSNNERTLILDENSYIAQLLLGQ